MSNRADRREDSRRNAMAKTAKTLHEASRKAGKNTSHSDHLRRVQGAERNRKDKR